MIESSENSRVSKPVLQLGRGQTPIAQTLLHPMINLFNGCYFSFKHAIKLINLMSCLKRLSSGLHLVSDADLFIFHDDVQHTKNDWRNRNKIKAPKGTQWLTVPVGNDDHRLICDVVIKDQTWQAKHWNFLNQHYGNCPHFRDYQLFFEDAYLSQQWGNLSKWNQHLIRTISKNILNLTTEFQDSHEYDLGGHKLHRLIELLTKAKADRDISGPAAKDHIDAARFTEKGIELVWKNYSRYPKYPQSYPPSEHRVSILDLLFNVGTDAPWYIWGWRENDGHSGI